MVNDTPKGTGAEKAAASDKLKKRQSDRNARKTEPQIGRALRSVYDDTVGEEIPPDLLELLGKLQ